MMTSLCKELAEFFVFLFIGATALILGVLTAITIFTKLYAYFN